MVKTLLTSLLVLLGLSLSAVQASEQNYPFRLAGKVDIVKSAYSALVIDDMSYILGPNVVIHGNKGTIATRRDIRNGIKVGVRLAQSAGSQLKIINELWILPGDFDLDYFNNDDDS